MLCDVIQTALLKKSPDLVISGAKVVNVFTEEILECDIAIKDGRIAGVFCEGELVGTDAPRFKADGLYAVPAFIDAHLHVESSMVTLTELARAVIPHGTGTIITDPHEIANVLGLRGIELLLKEAELLPLNVFFTAPSCVPAAKGIDTSGAKIGPKDVESLLRKERVVALAEMMNYPGVLNCDDEVMAKINIARLLGKPIDGHAPLVKGKELQAYASAGIHSDHESVTEEEAIQKLRCGLYLMVRCGSLACNIDILKGPLKAGLSLERVMLVTDDKHPDDLLEGHLEPLLREAVDMGVDPVKAIKMVTLTPATAFRLSGVGAIAPGYLADIALLRDLRSFRVEAVFLKGELLAREGKFVGRLPSVAYPDFALRTIKVRKLPSPTELLPRAPDRSKEVLVNVIIARDRSLVTSAGEAVLRVEGGRILPDASRDVLLIAVVERHGKSGTFSSAFVRGFGLREGAIASSVAHDSHNIVAVGASAEDVSVAISAVAEMQGGLVVVSGGELLAKVELPLAGLMSLESYEAVASSLVEARKAVRELGGRLSRPFMTLSFMALPVIPELKITDKGLFDVRKFEFVPVVREVIA